MIKQILFITLVIIACQASYKETDCNLSQYYLPDPMSVQGTAVVNLEPEVVVINFSVKTLEMVAEDSLQKNSNILTNAIEAIKRLGVEEKEISTTNLSIHPEYKNQYNKSTQNYTNIFQGYRVTNQLNIRSKQLEKAGKIIDSAIKNGVNSVESVSFDALNSTKKIAKDKLIQEAVKDAKSRAELALSALDHSIEGVKNVSIDSYNEPMYQRSNYKMAYAEMDMADEFVSETPLFSNDIKLSTSVTVSFLIKQNN